MFKWWGRTRRLEFELRVTQEQLGQALLERDHWRRQARDLRDAALKLRDEQERQVANG